jgi:predicted MFS family arabinose efflux permease
MSLGFVYLVFLPALLITPFAGRAARGIGPVLAIRLAFGAAIIGLPLLLAPSLPTVLVGLALIGAGTFAAQAIATGFVGRLATSDRGAASGLYLAAYYLGGLAGSAILGRIFDTAGWVACVAAITLSLLAALTLTLRLGRVFEPSRSSAQTNPS